MASFITFYSYKGGVGRTLALANVAWLLANHPTEPAKVLVLDFDLAAPGLHRVLGLKNPDSANGLVDYVLTYLTNAAVPTLDAFIHRTNHHRIDIIPAGRLDATYQDKLELVDWKAIYERAHGFHLIDALKERINDPERGYDYVLVDSLTGFSDVGGICVKQIPDSLVLLFRLNQQNLDGIETVYRSVQADRRIPVTPVITPAWPFTDSAAEEWIGKAADIFDRDALREISFDSGLSFGEKVVSQSYSKTRLVPKVVEDYRGLANHIRNGNPYDPLTLWRNLLEAVQWIGPDRRAEMHLSLLRLRPKNLRYWELLPRTLTPPKANDKSKLMDPAARLRQFVDEQCAFGNKFALLGRALVNFNSRQDSEPSPLVDVKAALKIDPEFADAHIFRIRLLIDSDKLGAAAKAFSVVRKLTEIDPKMLAQLAREIGDAYLTEFKADEAIRWFTLAKNLAGDDSDSYQLAKALYFTGNYEEALAETRHYASIGHSNEVARMLPAQILAALGRVDEARKILDDEKTRDGRRVNVANLAEAYLAIDPSETKALLRRQNVRIDPSIKVMLLKLADIFLGEEGEKYPPIVQTGGRIDAGEWNAFEILALLHAKDRAGQISPNDLLKAVEVLKGTLDLHLSAVKKAAASMEQDHGLN